MGIYIKHMKMPNSCVECPLYKESVCDAYETLAPYTFKDNERASFCPLTEVAEPLEEIWCDNYACIYCVNDTCTREPNEATVEAEISGNRDRDCPLSWG